MAAKTTSGSDFDLKFRLPALGCLLESGVVAVYREVLTGFTLRALRHAHVGSVTVRNSIGAFMSLKRSESEKPNFPFS